MSAFDAVASYSYAMRYGCGLRKLTYNFKGMKMLKSVLFASAAATLALCASARPAAVQRYRLALHRRPLPWSAAAAASAGIRPR